MKCGIYQIRNELNGRVYVGSAIDMPKRHYQHWHKLSHGEHHNAYLQADWNKCGSGAFKFECLELVGNRVDLLEREQFWLDQKHDSQIHCYNIRKLASSNLGIKYSKESCMRLSESHKGKSSRGKGYSLSDETKNKLRAVNLGKTVSVETKAKIALTMSGKAKSASSIEKRTLKVQKPVKQFTLAGVFIAEFQSATIASKETNVERTGIVQCCQEHRKSAGKFFWSY